MQADTKEITVQEEASTKDIEVDPSADGLMNKTNSYMQEQITKLKNLDLFSDIMAIIAIIMIMLAVALIFVSNPRAVNVMASIFGYLIFVFMFVWSVKIGLKQVDADVKYMCCPEPLRGFFKIDHYTKFSTVMSMLYYYLSTCVRTFVMIVFLIICIYLIWLVYNIFGRLFNPFHITNSSSKLSLGGMFIRALTAAGKGIIPAIIVLIGFVVHILVLFPFVYIPLVSTVDDIHKQLFQFSTVSTKSDAHIHGTIFIVGLVLTLVYALMFGKTYTDDVACPNNEQDCGTPPLENQKDVYKYYFRGFLFVFCTIVSMYVLFILREVGKRVLKSAV